MLIVHWLLLLSIIFLTGCNSPKLTHEHELPRFSSESYRHLDCQALKSKVDRLIAVIEQLSGVKNEPHYVMHTDMPFVGTGDNMGAVQLIRAKAERNAVQTVYGQKGCSQSAD